MRGFGARTYRYRATVGFAGTDGRADGDTGSYHHAVAVVDGCVRHANT